MLEDLLGATQLLVDFEGVEVGENAHDLGKAVNLKNVQEFKRLHFKTESSIYQQEDEVSNCRRVSIRPNGGRASAVGNATHAGAP